MAERRTDRTFGTELPQVEAFREKMARSRGVPLEDGERVSRPYVPPDGVQRSPAEERQINEAFATLFDGTVVADLVLGYLRSITIHAVAGPAATGHGELAHHAGQCYLQGLIETRVDLGKRRLPEV